jgi:hypothetical protein
MPNNALQWGAIEVAGLCADASGALAELWRWAAVVLAGLSHSVSPQRFALAVLIGAAVGLATWLFNATSPPIEQFALAHTEIGNGLVFVNLLPVAAGLFASGNVHQPSEAVIYAGILGNSTAAASRSMPRCASQPPAAPAAALLRARPSPSDG